VIYVSYKNRVFLRKSLALLLAFVFSAALAFAEDGADAVPPEPQKSRWYDGLFLEGSVHKYFAPKILDELVRPEIGFRGAFGYEFRRFRFALESGYTIIDGTNPLVLDVSLVPLVFKFGYALPLRWGLGLQADVGLGVMLSRSTYYDTAINMLTDKKTESKTNSPFAGARLYVTYTIPQNFLKIYAGGGADVLFEDSGPIPLPLIEAGVSLKPFLLASSIRNLAARLKPEPKIDPETIVFAHKKDNIIIEQTESGKTVRMLNAVYFEPNSVVMIEKYRPILDEAGARLKADPKLRITLRAYAAPLGTTEWQTVISAARAWFCAEYYIKQYGISDERMKIEYYGGEKTPEFVDASWESYRCVELILE